MEMWKTHSDVMMMSFEKKEKMGLAVFSKVALLWGQVFESFLGLALLPGPARCKEQSALLWAVPRSSPHPRSQYCYSNCIACITLHCIAMETCVSALHFKKKLLVANSDVQEALR